MLLLCDLAVDLLGALSSVSFAEEEDEEDEDDEVVAAGPCPR
ncbi:hypothetical protein ACU686_21400 [Yinghuangia aomiensis]